MSLPSPNHPERPHRRFLSPAVIASVLSLGSVTHALAQTAAVNNTNADLPPFPPPTTLLETREMPVAPWLAPSTPSTPEWLDSPYSPSPLIRPGLGIAAIGDNLTPTPSAGRSRPGGLTPFPIGPLDVGFDASYGLTYGTGVLTGPGQEDNSLRQTLTPGLNLYAGDRWTVRYAPTATFFSADGYKDTFDHMVSLNGSASAPNWNFGLNHATSTTSTPLVETGRQTDQTIHSSGLSARWDASDRDALTFSISQNIRFADGSPDSYSWANQNWYDRNLTDRISGGIGAGVSYDLLDPGTDMFALRLNGRIQGSLGQKLSYSVSGGAERRDFVGSDASAAISPLVSATITYQVLEKASLYAGFDHSIDISYFSDQYTENSSAHAGATYNFSNRWTGSVIGGFRVTGYQSSVTNDLTAREDVSSFTTVSLSWRPARRLMTTLSYSYRSNSSDQRNFEFDSHQLGLRITYSL